jgi:hypothetical protein
MVVTNQYSTEQAVLLANANNVVLRTRDDLMRTMASLNNGASSTASSPVA